MTGRLQDLRFGLRILRRSPEFSAAAMVTLALGIGVTTAVFSVANAVVFRPLQFPESNRVMTVLQASQGKAYKPMDSLYVEWRDRQKCFDLFAAALTFRRVLRDAGGAREIPVALVSAEFLLRIPLKWGADSGDVGQRRSGATLVTAMISEVPHLSQGFGC